MESVDLALDLGKTWTGRGKSYWSRNEKKMLLFL